MRKIKKIYYLFFVLVALTGCQEKTAQPQAEIYPPDRLPDNQAGEVVKKAMKYAGGWDQWATKKTFSFYKNITSYDSTGQAIKTVRQLHQYRLKPGFGARMTWELDGKKYTIINNGQQAWKYENGRELTDDQSKNEAWNSSFGSNYVVSMPYKLTDPGVILTYDGLDTLENEKVVHALKVSYEKGAGSSGGYHTWWYYFDRDTYDLAANYLNHGKGYSYTEYKTFTDVNGLRIHEKRHSHASDENKKMGILKTVYANEEMKFDTPLLADLFEPIEQ